MPRRSPPRGAGVPPSSSLRQSGLGGRRRLVGRIVPFALDLDRGDSLHFYRPEGTVVLATAEMSSAPIGASELTFIDAHGKLLPAGVELLSKVRKLPDRAPGEESGSAAESTPRALVRIE